MADIINIQHYDSPCGRLTLGEYKGRLCLCDWGSEGCRPCVGRRLKRLLKAEFADTATDVTDAARRQLDEYFRRERQAFDVPLLLVGTDFQKRVWTELQSIPYGTSLTYAQLAACLGQREAIRAVAGANGANALSIFVPCHRVIGTSGSLTGYAGGLAAKRFLLDLESPGIFG